MIRVGILSFAHLHAEAYMRGLQQIPSVEVIGIADDNLDRARYFAEQFNVTCFSSYETLLAERPHAVIVCSENTRHSELVCLAAEQGVHVLCEKPLATTLEDAQRMVSTCRDNHVYLMTAFPMRFSAPAVEIKNLISSGRLGRIYGVNSTNQGALPELHQSENLAFLKRNWFVDPEYAGGGALTDHIVHLADLLRWYLNAEVEEVFAVANSIMHRQHVKVETGGLVMLTFSNGTFASIDCSWSKPAYYPTWGGLKLEMVGEGGLATMDAFKQYFSLYSDQVGRPQWNVWGSDANQEMLAEFISAVRDNRRPSVTGEDGLRAVEIVTAAYRSVASGQPERINPV